MLQSWSKKLWSFTADHGDRSRSCASFFCQAMLPVSSISGLGIILSNFVPLTLSSAITMILNVLLLIIGFFTCGKEFGAKTVYTSIVLPLFLALWKGIFPNIDSLTDSQELDVLCYILVYSIGLSILLTAISFGGLDIVAKIMNKYLHMDLGKLCLCPACTLPFQLL